MFATWKCYFIIYFRSWSWKYKDTLILPLLDVIHCCELSLFTISKKNNEPNLRKWQKPSFAPDFGSFGPKFWPSKIFLWILSLLDVRHYCKLSLYVASRKITEPNLRKWQKTSFRPDFDTWARVWASKFFFEHFTSTRCYKLLQAIIVCNFKEN